MVNPESKFSAFIGILVKKSVKKTTQLRREFNKLKRKSYKKNFKNMIKMKMIYKEYTINITKVLLKYFDNPVFDPPGHPE